MTTELLLGLTGFIFAATATPGPNNALLLASGARFGFVRTLPHLTGILAGCSLMVVLVGLGLGGLIAASPVLYAALRYAGAAYLLFLAWKIAHAGGAWKIAHAGGAWKIAHAGGAWKIAHAGGAWKVAHAGGLSTGAGQARPMRFANAMAFQWVNPKAWIMVVGAVTTYAPRQDFVAHLLLIAMLFAIIGLPVISLWAGCGVALRRLLDRPWRMRAFSWTMAGLLVLSLYPILRD